MTVSLGKSKDNGMDVAIKIVLTPSDALTCRKRRTSSVLSSSTRQKSSRSFREKVDSIYKPL